MSSEEKIAKSLKIFFVDGSLGRSGVQREFGQEHNVRGEICVEI